MLFYPQVTTVQPLQRIQRERLLPNMGSVLVRRGQEVTPVQVVANTPRKTSFTVVPAFQLLGVSPDELQGYLRVQIDQEVREGNPLAQKKGFLGRNKIVKSPVTGTVVQINDGLIVIEKQPILLELRALMNATVAAIYMSRGVLLETNGSLIEGIWDSGKEGVGKLRLMTSDPLDTMPAEAISLELRGAVLAMGRVTDLAVLEKAEESGVRGIIAGTMPASLRQAAINLSFPILLTDGFGKTPMTTPIFDLLGQSAGRETTLLSRSTAGDNGRPVIIIPLPTDNPPILEVYPNDPMTAGQVVRIVRGENAGIVGEISNVYLHGKATAVGVRVPGADVTFANGQIVFVPYANLDLLV